MRSRILCSEGVGGDGGFERVRDRRDHGYQRAKLRIASNLIVNMLITIECIRCMPKNDDRLDCFSLDVGNNNFMHQLPPKLYANR